MKNLFLLLISLILASCSDDNFGLDFDQDAYETNRILWENNNNLDYTFALKASSGTFGPGPKLVTVVKNGELDNIAYAFSEDASFYEDEINNEEFFYIETIDDVFDFINLIAESSKEDINSSESHMLGAKIDVEYDENNHFPKKVDCSGRYPSGYAGGLDIAIYITDFMIITE